ncbi:PilZ domain-containing protein [bacterium]|nr:PilZ domain-containing protein [bacterium]
MPFEDSAEDERRESFRLDDTVTLKIRLLDEASYHQIAEDFSAYRLQYCMKSHMQNQKDMHKPKLMLIKKSDPEIAEYLESLETQIAQLAERMDKGDGQKAGTKQFSGRANISSGGIQFHTDMLIKVSQAVEIGIVLSTSNTQVMMLGDVTRVENETENRKAVSIRYTHIHPEDAEAVIRHLAKLQQLKLQSRRGAE